MTEQTNPVAELLESLVVQKLGLQQLCSTLEANLASADRDLAEAREQRNRESDDLLAITGRGGVVDELNRKLAAAPTEEELNTLKEHRDYLLRQVQGARREFAKCWHIDDEDSLADLVVRLRRERSEARREAKGAGDATDVTGPGGTVLRRDLAIVISEHRDQPGVPSTWVGWDSCIVRLLESEPMQRLRKVWLAQDRIEGPAALPAIDPDAPKPESHGPCEVCGTSWVGDITACPGCQAGRERTAAHLASSEYLTKARQWVQENQWYAKGGVVNPAPPTSGGNPTDGTNP